MAVYFSGNVAGHINEVSLHQAWFLVLLGMGDYLQAVNHLGI